MWVGMRSFVYVLRDQDFLTHMCVHMGGAIWDGPFVKIKLRKLWRLAIREIGSREISPLESPTLKWLTSYTYWQRSQHVEIVCKELAVSLHQCQVPEREAITHRCHKNWLCLWFLGWYSSGRYGSCKNRNLWNRIIICYSLFSSSAGPSWKHTFSGIGLSVWDHYVPTHSC